MAEKLKKTAKKEKVVVRLTEMQKIRLLENKNIEEEIIDLKKQLFKFRFDATAGKLEKTHQLNKTKKRIARLKTVLTERADGIR